MRPSLLLAAVGVVVSFAVLSACPPKRVDVVDGPPAPGTPLTKLVPVADFDPRQVESGRVSERLTAGGVTAVIEGSRRFLISVGPDDVEKAVAILRSPELVEFMSFYPRTGTGRGIVVDGGYLADGGWGAGTSVPHGTFPDGGVAVCCACIDDITIKNIRNTANLPLYGHEFDTEFKVSYVANATNDQDAVLEWLEKTNRGYTPDMVPNNTWHDMTRDPATAGSFVAWAGRTRPCPGSETVTDTDPPSANINLPARTLEFRVTVYSAPGCNCTNASKTVTATQVLAPNGATPPGIGTQDFTTP